MTGADDNDPAVSEREFGPKIGKRRRLAFAAVAIAAVLGFLVIALTLDLGATSTMRLDGSGPRVREEPSLLFFLLGCLVIVGISVFFHRLLDRDR